MHSFCRIGLSQLVVCLARGRQWLVLLLVLSVAGISEGQVHRARYLTGEVRIDTTVEGEIRVAVDESTNWPAPDGLADHLFVLHQEKPPYQFVSESLDNATLLVHQNRVTVVSRSDQSRVALFLGVKQDADSPPVNVPVADFAPTVIEGHSLSHTQGGFDAPVTVIASEAFPVRQVGGQDIVKPGERGCLAGGPGSLSCSIQSCGGRPSGGSISCSAGRYACCSCEPSAQLMCITQADLEDPEHATVEASRIQSLTSQFEPY